MAASHPIPETTQALAQQKPLLWRAFAFSVIAGLLVLAPTWYMLEVYDRVVNSRSLMTLAMLTLLVLMLLAVMEVLEWARADTLRAGDQPEFPQPAQRLAHRGAADAEALAKLLLRRQQGAHGSPPVQDRRRQFGRHRRVERLAAGQKLRGVRRGCGRKGEAGCRPTSRTGH